MLRRIDPVVAAGEHGDRAAFNAGAVRGLVDAAGEPGDHDKAGVAEVARQRACKFQPGTGGVAGAHDRNHRPRQRLPRAAHGEQGRRVIEGGEPRRIVNFTRREQADAELLACGDFGARFLERADATCRAATARQVGQVRERGARIAEMTDQRAEGARPDILGPDQPQAVEPLGFGEVSGAG